MGRAIWLSLVLLGACERNIKTEAKPEPPLAVAPVADGFGDWVRITPNAERLRCANHADEEWQVYLEAGKVAARRAERREPNTGPDLPFEVDVRGRRHVLGVVDGFLAGFDAGEWGGSLHWFSTDGKQRRELAKENVAGIVAIDNDSAVVFEGLAHLSLDEGRVRWLARDAAKGWREASNVALDGAARTFTRSGDVLYVITTKSLTRIDRDKRVSIVQTLPDGMAGLYPDSMIADGSGRLYVGMRQLVLRLVPAGKTYTLEWFAPKGCAEAVANDFNCICTK